MGKTISFTSKQHSWLFFTSSILVSFGVLIVTIGGSWDITNHLLNRPETFFSPPHAILYIGVAIALASTVIKFFSWKNFQNDIKSQHAKQVKLTILGIAILVGAGPFDFFWHSNFGLDGLLSPPHLFLISGMILCSTASMTSIVRHSNKKLSTNSYTPFHFLIIIGLLAVLLSTSGLFYSFSLPFSDTEHFNFNPDPMFAIAFTTIAFPFLFASILYLSSSFVNGKFGIASLVGTLFLIINASTSIAQNSFLIPTLGFYFLGVIPIIIFDAMLSNSKRKLQYIAGAIPGICFYFFYFPLITHTYNEVFSHQIVWPSMTALIYFEMLESVFPLVVVPAALAGILGTIFASKISQKLRLI
ncbi:MAG: hypothetical protein FJ359_02375 [Thaumarchaeota archaeon]|nr:hypothetical protein [Nitrososphaerota archaeon]